MNRKLEILKILKKAHDVYQVSNNEQRIRLFDAIDHLIEELYSIDLAYPRVITESLVMFGGEFWAAHLKDAGAVDDGDVSEIFGK